MDYYQIGQRIRKFRKLAGLSQEQLAEQAGISVTHMSHIETGNTKLSLSVFAAISQALNVQADYLLFDFSLDNHISSDEVCDILATCSEKQAHVILEIIRSIKAALDKYGV